MLEEFGVFRARDKDAHFIVVDLVEFVEIEARDDTEFLVEVAFGLEIFAEAGADKFECAQPVDFLRLELVLP